MKITNQTKYSTSQLKTLIEFCRKEAVRREGLKHALVKSSVHFTGHPTRRGRFFSSVPAKGWVGGSAYANSNWMTLKLPNEKRETADYWCHGTKAYDRDFSQSIASTYFHELGHCLGMKGHTARRTIEHHYKDWVTANISNEKFPVEKQVKAPAKKENLTVKKLSAAQSNLKRAETRFKRAKTLLAKWNRKVKYYEKKALALSPG